MDVDEKIDVHVNIYVNVNVLTDVHLFVLPGMSTSVPHGKLR